MNSRLDRIRAGLDQDQTEKILTGLRPAGVDRIDFQVQLEQNLLDSINFGQNHAIVSFLLIVKSMSWQFAVVFNQKNQNKVSHS